MTDNYILRKRYWGATWWPVFYWPTGAVIIPPVTPECRTFIVMPDYRMLVISPDCRTFRACREDRVIVVERCKDHVCT